jgi:L-threonylcarbamoyladenylate synthase
VGIESTVVDLTVAPPKILRPGMIHLESIAAVTGSVQSPAAGQATAALRSPGLLEKHYSPKAKLIVLNWRNETDLRAQLAAYNFQLPTIHILAHTCIPVGLAAENVSVIPHDAEAFARALYSELHQCDAAGAQLIIVEAPPESPEWSGIADRLKRAAA